MILSPGGQCSGFIGRRRTFPAALALIGSASPAVLDPMDQLRRESEVLLDAGQLAAALERLQLLDAQAALTFKDQVRYAQALIRLGH